MEQVAYQIPRKPVPTPTVGQLEPPNEDITPAQQQPRPCLTSGWRPFWMRRSVLLAFVLCYMLVLIASELLDLYSTKLKVIASIDAVAHYYWTYGPTAVLTLVFAFWSRVDYRIRQMTPWVVLSKPEKSATTTSAKKGVLLDYISPTIPEILWNSLTKHHWAVLASCCISLLQTALIVVSTGLLTLSPTPKTSETLFKTNTKFVNVSDIADAITSLSASNLPAARYDAIRTLNMTYPFGTTARYVYQTFRPMDSLLSPQVVQQANVDILSIDIDCEAADLSLRPLKSGGGMWQGFTQSCIPYWQRYADLSSKTCNASIIVDLEAIKTDDVGNFAYHIPDYHVNLDRQESQHCEGERLYLGVGQYKQIDPFPVNKSCRPSSLTRNITTELRLIRSRNWICKPKAKIVKGTVTFSPASVQAGESPDIKFDANAEQGSFVGDIGNFVYKMMNEGNFKYERETAIAWTGYGWNDGYINAQNKIFQRAPNATVEEMMTTDLYLDMSNELFIELGIQALSSVIVQSADDTITGNITKSENRLQVRRGPLRAFQSILGIMIVLACVLATQLPTKSVVRRDPATLGGLYELMSCNPVLFQVFQDQGSAGEPQLSELCSQWHFRVYEGQIDIDPVVAKSEQTKVASLAQKMRHLKRPFKVFKNLFQCQLLQFKRLKFWKRHQSEKKNGGALWWLPLPGRQMVSLPACLIVVLIAVTLQVLLMLSKRWGGLVEVSSNENKHPAWTFVPAGVMVTVALYFKALQSTYRTMAPYYDLRAGTKASRSINCNYLSVVEVEALVMSLRKRQMGVFFMTLSTILSAFLTIFVSGVFTAVTVPSNDTVSLHQTSWFSGNGSDEDGNTKNNALLAGLILEANLSYPAWTYQNLALPSVNSLDAIRIGSADADRGQRTVRTTIPAIRPSLNCTLYNQEDFPDLNISSRWIESRMPGYPECAGNPPSYIAPVDAPYFSGLLNGDLNVNRNLSLQHCPILNYFWGSQAQIGPNNTTAITHIKALLCHEIVEQVDVEITFRIPTFAIDTTRPPAVQESTAKPFSSAFMAIPYNAMPFVQRPYTSMPSHEIVSTSDRFFGALAYKYGLTDVDLGDPSKTESITRTIQEMHGIIRAQQYNVALRYDESNKPTATKEREGDTTYSAVLNDPQRYRLVQDEISTHILTAILIAMVVCALLASWFMSLRYILHKNPCSIAAMLSLLADSNLPADVPSSAGDPANGYFKMGWFNREMDGKRVYTIHYDRSPEPLHRQPSSSTKGWKFWSFGRHGRTKAQSGTLLQTT